MAWKLSKDEKRLRTLALETAKQKAALLEQLKKTPIVQIACERIGVGRSTYYAWRRDDPTFLKDADTALEMGVLLINDLAESQLIKNMQDGNNTAIIFWLKNHHSQYNERIRYQLELPESLITEDLKQSVSNAIKNIGLATILKEHDPDMTVPKYEAKKRKEHEERLAKLGEVPSKKKVVVKKKSVNINDILKKRKLST